MGRLVAITKEYQGECTEKRFSATQEIHYYSGAQWIGVARCIIVLTLEGDTWEVGWGCGGVAGDARLGSRSR